MRFVLLMAVLALAFPARAAAIAGPENVITTTLEGLVGATDVTISHCAALDAHYRCRGAMTTTHHHGVAERCTFVAREYPHGKDPGDADGYVDLRVGACRRVMLVDSARRRGLSDH